MARVFKIIPALDCSLGEAVALARRVDALDGIYGYKVGFALGLSAGLPRVVEELRKVSQKPLLYDHQKAATDIPDTGALFAKTLAEAGITEAILFPQAGPTTLAAWTHALQERRIKVIVGAIMTHPRYLVSEGGFLVDACMLEVYPIASRLGVRAFVVPLTKPELVQQVHERLGPGEWEYYSPGLGQQGGAAADLGFLERRYAIVGRSLLAAPDPTVYVRSILDKEGSQG